MSRCKECQHMLDDGEVKGHIWCRWRNDWIPIDYWDSTKWIKDREECSGFKVVE